MFSKLRRFRPSHATVVAYLALFVALGGTAYAAATIGSAEVVDDSLQSVDLKDNAAVGSRDVVNDSVTGGGLGSVDVRNNSLTSNDVAALTGADVTDDSLKGADVEESSLGQVPSARNAESATSADDASNAFYLNGRHSSHFLSGDVEHTNSGLTTGTTDSDGVTSAAIFCGNFNSSTGADPVLGGGFSSLDNGTRLISSQPWGRSGWQVSWANNSTPDSMVVWIVCGPRG